jgi:hypothetical protein
MAKDARTPEPERSGTSDTSRLTQTALKLFSHIAVLVLGTAISWYLFPRVLVLPVPVDPQAGVPLSSGLSDPAPRRFASAMQSFNPDLNNSRRPRTGNVIK